MQHDQAGDPVTGIKWTRKTTAKIAFQLKQLGINVSDRTVAKLLEHLGFSLRVNAKKKSNGVKDSAERDRQFRYIEDMVRIREVIFSRALSSSLSHFGGSGSGLRISDLAVV
ncbi:MAG: hypothetical protein O3A00_28095, partial [Planctomycetota bacterium]|nr:hypothetical protein [Planctomycetota bacterium]